jgi:ribosomal 50S subunit-recycling heat shock protein
VNHLADVDEDEEDGGELLAVVVDEATAGQRLDAVIAATTALSRVAAQRLIEAGRVMLDGVVVTKQASKPKAGQAIAIQVPPAASTEIVAEALPLTILFEDDASDRHRQGGRAWWCIPAPGHLDRDAGERACSTIAALRSQRHRRRQASALASCIASTRTPAASWSPASTMRCTSRCRSCLPTKT